MGDIAVLAPLGDSEDLQFARYSVHFEEQGRRRRAGQRFRSDSQYSAPVDFQQSVLVQAQSCSILLGCFRHHYYCCCRRQMVHRMTHPAPLPVR